MESEVSFKQWNHPVEQLEESLKTLSQMEIELASVKQSMMRQFHGEEWDVVRRGIREQEEMLHKQMLYLEDMKIALEKIKRLYENCENEIILFGEENRKWMPEYLNVMDLGAWKLVPFQLADDCQRG